MLFLFKVSYVFSMLLLLVAMLGIREAFVIDDIGLHEHLGGPEHEHEHEHGETKYITNSIFNFCLYILKTN